MANEPTSVNLGAAESKYDQAWAMYGRGELAKAKELLLSYSKKDVNLSDEVRYLLGKIEIDQGNAVDAIAYLQPICDGRSPTCDALIEFGNALEDAGRLSEAKAAWERAIERDERRHEAYVCLGAADYNKGKFEPALKVVTKGLSKVDSFEGTLLLRKGAALCEIELKNFEQAMTHLDYLINRCPDYGIFYYYRSQCWLGIGEREKALRDAAEAVKHDPEDNDFVEFYERLKI